MLMQERTSGSRQA